MLVLSRKVGERIRIGDQINVVIVRINGNAVRVGIEAPTDMTVIRAELQQRTNPDDSIQHDSIQHAAIQEGSPVCEETPVP